MTKKIGFVSLGCAKNQVNMEQMIFLASEAGYEIAPEAIDVDVAVVNTCGFIDAAKTEAIDNILALADLKEAGRVGKIIVSGCLSQRYRKEILDDMPEVDGVLGTGSYFQIVEAIQGVLAGERVELYGDINAPLNEPQRILTTPSHFAYLRIAEGCDNHCSFCIIPKLRGKYRSRPMEDLMIEAKQIADSGVKELIVVAQDTSRYGIDLYGELKLAYLLKSLCKLDFQWVRIHYLYPDEMPDELIDTIASEPKIVKYLDIPIQHVNNAILKRMNRRGTQEYLGDLFTKLRDRIPGLVLRTSVITGLPGEGDEEFEQLCTFIKAHRLERVGAFAFSPEEGTAAAKMEFPDQEIAIQRAEILSELASRIIDKHNEDRMNQVYDVLVEGYDEAEEAYFGRTYAESPDIDGKVWFTAEEDVLIGDFVKVLFDDIVDGEPVGGLYEEE
ncbi:MAG: 30S ribosomal protein S12 methylthiotransferase RimO [Eubacteriales bacterium]